jgi:hypothetical protein
MDESSETTSEPALDWSSAEVSDGTLKVTLSGDHDDDWDETFVRTLALLSSGGAWGRPAFKKSKVTVEGVEEGEEDSLRFALDGAVQEANAHQAQDDSSDDEDGDGESSGGDGDGHSDADQRMTDRFRESPGA